MVPQKKDNRLEARLKSLRQSYARELPALLKRLQGFFGKVVNSEAKDREALSEVFRLVHSITGSGPSFGFHRLGELAQEMELLTDHILKNPDAWNSEVSAKAAGILKQIRDAATKPEPATNESSALVSKSQPEPAEERLPIAWLDPNPEDSQEIRRWLALFGLETECFTDPKALLDGGRSQNRDAVIIDLSRPEWSLKSLQKELHQIKSNMKQIPSIYLLPEALALPKRLLAYENGADACFNFPLDFLGLVTKLDQVIASEGEGPFRLLIVEDDVVLADHIATIMRKAGLEVAVLSDPLGIETVLAEFRPELILMDLYLGSCSGNALAKLVRQKEAYMNIPIVYISTETELAKRLEAFEVGADDFLLKPVKYHYLYYTLHSRMKRSRLLQINLTRDSLTGLLDHGSIRQKLADTVKWAIETGKPLTFAIIDLDNIGEVNQVLGSKGGDAVLKTLAKLLDMNVRGKGWAGRYGGKEFSLILPGMTAAEARSFLEPLRAGFAEIVHGRQWTKEGIKVSFSGGLASPEEMESSAKVATMALRALRSAQAEGGNKLISVPAETTPANPLPASVPAILADEDDELIFFLEDDEDSSRGASSKVATSPIPDHEPVADLGIKIVIVDDEKQMLSWLEAQMRALGYQVWSALTGDEGYELVVKHQPHFLLTDLLLFPGVHGFELCRKVKLNPDLAKVDILVMTAVYRDDRYRREATDAGAKVFITKPVEIGLLNASLQELINADTE